MKVPEQQQHAFDGTQDDHNIRSDNLAYKNIAPWNPIQGSEETNLDVVATLHFYEAPKDDADPYFKVTHASGAGEKNYSHDLHKVEIKDMRPYRDQLSLETHSFMVLCDIPPFPADICSDRAEELISTLIHTAIKGCQKVVVFDQVLRRAFVEEKWCRPVRKVHVDQGPAGAMLRAQRHLSPSDFRLICEGKLWFRIINIWRPHENTVLDHPIAVADSRTVEDKDLIPVKHIYPDRTGETLAVKFNPSQEFWWWPFMKTTDALVFQCYDSAKSLRCAHASFRIPGGLEYNTRTSVEVRCIAVGQNGSNGPMG